MSSSSEAGAFFDERATRYDSDYDARGADGHALRARLAVALQLLGPGPGEALDAGMGPGRLASELARRGWEVSGVDTSIEMVELARLRLPEAADRLVHGEIEALPFPDGAFDAVVATGVLEYANVPRALAELGRVLRPGGRAIVSYPNPRALYGLWKTRAYYPVVDVAKRLLQRPGRGQPRGSQRLSADRFRALLTSAGLQPEVMEHTSFLIVPSPLDTLLPQAAERLGRRLEGSGARLGAVLATQIVYTARRTA